MKEKASLVTSTHYQGYLQRISMVNNIQINLKSLEMKEKASLVTSTHIKDICKNFNGKQDSN